MFGKILVFVFEINDVLENRQLLLSTVSFRWITVILSIIHKIWHFIIESVYKMSDNIYCLDEW